MSSFLKWPGGKRGELYCICPEIPPYKRYFEPFLGGGAVWLNQPPAKSYLNDSHPLLIALYRYVRNRDADFQKMQGAFIDCWDHTHPNERSELYYQARDRYNNAKDIDRRKVLDFWILRELAYAGMFRFNGSGGFNVPFGHSYINKNLRKKADFFWSAEVATIMDRATFYDQDFYAFLRRFTFSGDDFIFIDPPYHCDFTDYGDKDFTQADHQRLGNLLPRLNAKFMLIIQNTDFVIETYLAKGFSVAAYDKKYSFNLRGRNNQTVEHLRITNY